MSGVAADEWRERLAREFAGDPTVGRWLVVDEAGSTQDLARELDPGGAVTALRQVAGRGRLGRSWADTGFDGLAVTFVLPQACGADPWLAIAAALAAARAVEAVAGLAMGIKWPNDLVFEGRKLGGILIERTARATLVGVGINVTQVDFPDEIAAVATSLARAGRPVARLDLLVALARDLPPALAEPIASREAEFARRDALRGGWIRAISAGETVEGRVLAVEPVQGIRLETAGGERFLPAATASIVSWRSASAKG
jgi:BirA family biotin operon repressor/biotin-[acetyl-CoA-carboxylase] ligase